jgi:citrate synthase
MNPKKTWRTAISRFDAEGVEIAGYPHEELIRKLDFASMLFVLYQQRVPSRQEARVLDAMLVSVIDHSVVASSAVTRIVAASGVPLQASVAAGILTIGDIHGGAGQELSRRLEEWVNQAQQEGMELREKATRIVRALRETGERVEGYGHPLHPKGDSRVDALIDVARENGLEGPHLQLALHISAAIEAASGKALPLNIDGVIAALASDLGFDWRLGRAFIFVPRTAGLAAQAVEEATRERGWRKIASPEDIEYDGPASRPLVIPSEERS